MRGPQTTQDILKNLRDRIVSLEETKKEIGESIKEIYTEADALGFDKKALRAIVKETMKDEGDKAKAIYVESLIRVYRSALGMLDRTPLGDAAIRDLEEAVKKSASRHGVDDDDDPAPKEPRKGGVKGTVPERVKKIADKYIPRHAD